MGRIRVNNSLSTRHCRQSVAEEDAQSIPFRTCRDQTYPPAWTRLRLATRHSIVFGEGAGKTAMRMQMAGRIALHNARPQNGALFLIEYDDFNPFLDRAADRLGA
jgi:hypothetical protein